MKRAITKVIFVLTIGIALPIVSVSANEEIGFFYNDDLQDALSKKYYLTTDSDSKKIDFPFSDFIIWQIILRPQEKYFSEIENINYCLEYTDLLSPCDLTKTTAQKLQLKKGAIIYIDQGNLGTYLESIEKDVGSGPVNGRLQMTEEGKLIVLEKSKPGYQIDKEASLQQILNAIKNNPEVTEIPLVTKLTLPEISTDDVSQLGIKDKIGHGESNFSGSPSNRRFNIRVATNKFDGIVLKPEEEFSFVELLGPVDGENGYKEELVIKDNETIPEFGGGICQVSTTMFRAALNSGFKITERRNHAYPVQYYSPQGTDATIYIPKPDLMFVNNTPAHVLIQSFIEGNILSFDVYGTADGRRVELEGPRVTQRTEDGKMRTILHQVVKDEGGNEIRRATFKSFYDNPDNYHHEPLLTEKPKNWSKSEWKNYKKEHGL